MAGYLNDPREMSIRPESGVTLENDNRVEDMWHWRAMVLDLCNMPVEEYMKPGFIIGSGGTTGSTPQTEQVRIYMSILKDGEAMDPSEVSTTADSGETGTPLWEAKWEWAGTIVMPVKVAAVIRTESGSYSGSTILRENGSKSVTITLEGAEGENLVAIERFGVGSVDTMDSSIVNPTYSYTDSGTNRTYKYDVSLDESFISFKISFVISGSEVHSEYLREGEEIPFSSVTTDREGYTFIGWADENGDIFTGTTMPASNLTLTGKYEINSYTEDIWYHGYFLTPVSAWTSGAPEVHFNVEDLDDPDIYTSAATKDYVGTGKEIVCIIRIYEPFLSMTQVQFVRERDKWYAPFTYLFPVSVVDRYNIQIKDVADYDIFPACYKSSAPVQINGIDYWMYVRCTEGLRPGKEDQDFYYTLILTEK